jgi:DNA repair protein RecO
MSHHIYHTRGIILSSTPSGESNRFYKIFTEELGLIGGAAQSVREAKSKLKYTLQDYSLVTVDLVRGKEVWRIISAGAWNPLDVIKGDELRMRLFARYCALLSRLLQGEGRDQELFDEIISVADFLGKNQIEENLEFSFETLVAFRVLVHLGYMNPVGYESFFEKNTYFPDILQEFEKIQLEIIPKINDALSASHL